MNRYPLNDQELQFSRQHPDKMDLIKVDAGFIAPHRHLLNERSRVSNGDNGQ